MRSGGDGGGGGGGWIPEAVLAILDPAEVERCAAGERAVASNWRHAALESVRWLQRVAASAATAGNGITLEKRVVLDEFAVGDR